MKKIIREKMKQQKKGNEKKIIREIKKTKRNRKCRKSFKKR